MIRLKLARFATCLLLMLVFVPLAFAASSRYQTIFVDQVSEIIPYWKLNAQVDGLMVARAGETGELGLSIVAGFDFDAMDVKEPPSYESIKAAPLKDVKSFGLSEEAMARFALPKSEGGFADGFKHPDEFSLDGLEVSPENAWTHRVAFSVKPDYPLDEYYSEFDDVERVYVPRQYCEMEGVGVEMHPAGWESENKEFFLSGSPTKLSFALEDERRGCTKAEATICARDSKYCYKKDLHETFDSNKHCVDCYLDEHCETAGGEVCDMNSFTCVTPVESGEESVEGKAPRVFEVSFSVGGKPLFVPVFVFEDEFASGKPFLSSRLVFSVPGDDELLLDADKVKEQLCLDPRSPDNDAVRNADPRKGDYANKDVFGFVLALDNDPHGKLLASMVPNLIYHYSEPMPFGTELIKRFLVLSDASDHSAPSPHLTLYYELGEQAHATIKAELVYPDPSVLEKKELVEPARSAKDFFESMSFPIFKAYFWEKECPKNPYLESNLLESSPPYYTLLRNTLFDNQDTYRYTPDEQVDKSKLCGAVRLYILGRPFYPAYDEEHALTAGLPNGVYKFVLTAEQEDKSSTLSAHYAFNSDFNTYDWVLLQTHPTATLPPLSQYVVETDSEGVFATADYRFKDVDVGMTGVAFQYQHIGDTEKKVYASNWLSLTDEHRLYVNLDTPKGGQDFKYQYVSTRWLGDDAWNSEYGYAPASGQTLRFGEIHEFKNGDEFVFTKVGGNLVLTIVRNSVPAVSRATGLGSRGEPCANVGDADSDQDDKVTEAELNTLDASSELLEDLKKQFNIVGKEYTFNKNENEFCEAGLVCVLARTNHQEQPKYWQAELTCVKPESVTGTYSCNLVRIPQRIFNFAPAGITECLGENKQCREDYGAYASDGAYRCGPQWINLYRLKESCGGVPAYVAAEAGAETEFGVQPELRVQTLGDQVPEESRLESRQAVAELTEIAKGKGAPAVFSVITVAEETAPVAEESKRIVVAKPAMKERFGGVVAPAPKYEVPGREVPEAVAEEPELPRLTKLVAVSQPPTGLATQLEGACPAEIFAVPEAATAQQVLETGNEMHAAAQENLADYAQLRKAMEDAKERPVPYNEVERIRSGLSVSSLSSGKVLLRTLEGGALPLPGAEKLQPTGTIQIKYADYFDKQGEPRDFGSWGPPELKAFNAALEAGVYACYKPSETEGWRAVKLVAVPEPVQGPEAEAIINTLDSALASPFGTVTFRYAEVRNPLNVGGYIMRLREEIGSSLVKEGESTIIARLQVYKRSGKEALAPLGPLSEDRFQKTTEYAVFQDKVQDLLLSEISDEDKQDFLREAFEDVYVCYKFPDSIGWRAVKLVYESGE